MYLCRESWVHFNYNTKFVAKKSQTQLATALKSHPFTIQMHPNMWLQCYTMITPFNSCHWYWVPVVIQDRHGENNVLYIKTISSKGAERKPYIGDAPKAMYNWTKQTLNYQEKMNQSFSLVHGISCS